MTTDNLNAQAVEQLRREVDTLKELLRKVEWVRYGQTHDEEGDAMGCYECSSCGFEKPNHKLNCPLHKALHE